MVALNAVTWFVLMGCTLLWSVILLRPVMQLLLSQVEISQAIWIMVDWTTLPNVDMAFTWQHWQIQNKSPRLVTATLCTSEFASVIKGVA